MNRPHDGPSDDRIIARNVPLPAGGATRYSPEECGVVYERYPEGPMDPAEAEKMMIDMMSEPFYRSLLFNQTHPTERYCPACKLHYRRPENPTTVSEQEQEMSGICSTACFVEFNGPFHDDDDDASSTDGGK